MDVQLTIDIGKILGYMTKYVSKSEASTTAGAQRMIRRVLKSATEQGQSVNQALRRTMGKLLGERTMTKDECCHLILSNPTVFCSHTFPKIHLDDKNRRVQPSDGAGNDDEASKRVTLMSLVEAYKCRMDNSKWLSKDDFNANEDQLEGLSLARFGLDATVGQRGAHRNKIKLRPRDSKVVLMFMPDLPSEPGSPTYTNYCRYSLMKHKPWEDDPNTLWGGADATEKEIQKAWTTFLENCRQNGCNDDVALQLKVDEYKRAHAHRRRANEPNLDDSNGIDPADLEQEPWQVECDVQPDSDDVDPALSTLKWDRDHDWSESSGECSDVDPETMSQQYQNMIEDFAQELRFAAPPTVELNELQQLAKEMILGLVDSTQATEKLGILIGRGGTGKSTSIGAAEYELEQLFGAGCVMKLATTGKAATVIGGSTVHSPKYGLGVPVSEKQLKKLSGKTLQRLQERLKGVKLIVIDEYSMLRARELFFIDQILRQVGDPEQLYGGFAVLLVGDPAQIPPVKGQVLWTDNKKSPEADKNGHLLYDSFFHNVIELEEV